MRAAGPDSRVHVEARDALAGVFRAWTRSPDRYVEVAETLAALVSGFADEQRRERWEEVAENAAITESTVARGSSMLITDEWRCTEPSVRFGVDDEVERVQPPRCSSSPRRNA